MGRRGWAFGVAAIVMATSMSSALWMAAAVPAAAESDVAPPPSPPAPDQTEPSTASSDLKQISLNDIKTVIISLGYDLQPNPYPEIKIVNDKGAFFIGFSLSQNNTIVSAYIILHTIPPEKLKTMPVCKILYFNDTHTTYYSLNDKDADKRIILNAQMEAGAVSAKSMQAMIQTIVVDTVGSDKIWNPNLWTDTSFPADCTPDP